MGNQRQRRRYKRAAPGERFLLLPDWVLASENYRPLPDDAKAILVDMCRRWSGPSMPPYRINNNGQIGYGSRAAAAIGIAKSNAALALLRLERAGFIDGRDRYHWRPVAEDGKRRAREYRVTFLPSHGQIPTWRNPTPKNIRRIMLKHVVLDSPAYRHLRSAAKVALVEMLRRETGGNNGRIRFCGNDHHTVGQGSSQITNRALRALQAAGFIVETRPTQPSGKKGVPGKTRTWRLTMIEANREKPTMDFLAVDAKSAVDKNVSPVPLVNDTPSLRPIGERHSKSAAERAADAGPEKKRVARRISQGEQRIAVARTKRPESAVESDEPASCVHQLDTYRKTTPFWAKLAAAPAVVAAAAQRPSATARRRALSPPPASQASQASTQPSPVDASTDSMPGRRAKRKHEDPGGGASLSTKTGVGAAESATDAGKVTIVPATTTRRAK